MSSLQMGVVQSAMSDTVRINQVVIPPDAAGGL